MKKIFSIFISFLMLVYGITPVFSAENNVQISGADELLDEICLSSDSNASVREKIQETYQTYLERLIPQIMGNPDSAKQKMGRGW